MTTTPPTPPSAAVPKYQLAQRVVFSAASHFAVKLDEILGSSREKRIVRARHVAAYVMRELNFSYPEIGLVLRRDHTSVMDAVRGIGGLVSAGDAGAMSDVASVRRLVDGALSPIDEVNMRISALEIRVRDIEAQLDAFVRRHA